MRYDFLMVSVFQLFCAILLNFTQFNQISCNSYAKLNKIAFHITLLTLPTKNAKEVHKNLKISSE